jgi:hypothetical protein
LARLQSKAKAAQQYLEESQSSLSLQESLYESTRSKCEKVTRAVQSGTMTMSRLRAAVAGKNHQDMGDRAKVIQGQIDRVESVLRREIQNSSKANEADDDGIVREIDELKEQLLQAQKELEELKKT